MVQERAARVGLDRTGVQAKEAVEAAVAQLAGGSVDREVTQAAVGELLLAAVDLARAADVDAEQALRERVDKLVADVGRGARDPDARARGRGGAG